MVLFGSRAGGGLPPSDESDLDVAISLTPSDSPPGFWTCWDELAPIFPDEKLDLVLLHDVDPLFRWEIVEKGILLWGDPIDFLEFRAFAHRDFVDSADLRELERTLFDKKMAYIRRRLGAAA